MRGTPQGCRSGDVVASMDRRVGPAVKGAAQPAAERCGQQYADASRSLSTSSGAAVRSQRGREPFDAKWLLLGDAGDVAHAVRAVLH